MEFPLWYARFNKRFTNKVVMLWAGWTPGTCIVEHVGRKSGKTYRTPVLAFDTEGGLVVLVGYGPNTEWALNVGSAGSARIRRHGAARTVVPAATMTKSDARPRVRWWSRPLYALVPFDVALVLAWQDG